MQEQIQALSGDIPMSLAYLQVTDMPFHLHKDVLELIFVLDGKLELVHVNDTLTLTPGSFAICNGNELHRLVGEQNTILAIIHLDISQYKKQWPDIDAYLFTVKGSPASASAFDKFWRNTLALMHSYQQVQGAPSELWELGKSLLQWLIQDFQHYYIGSYRLEQSNIFRENEIQLGRLRRCMDYSYQNYYKSTVLEEIAKLENITPNHLTYILRQGIGINFRDFLHLVRAEKSAPMVLNTTMPLGQVAGECGFSKYKYFTQSFVKLFGMTPAEYRKRYGKETILVKQPAYQILEYQQVRPLLSEQTPQVEPLSINLDCLPPSQSFPTPQFLWTQETYEHTIDFPLITQARETLGLGHLCIPHDAFGDYHHRPHLLHTIESKYEKRGITLTTDAAPMPPPDRDDSTMPSRYFAALCRGEAVPMVDFPVDDNQIQLPMYHLHRFFHTMGATAVSINDHCLLSQSQQGYILLLSYFHANDPLVSMDNIHPNAESLQPRKITVSLCPLTGTYLCQRFVLRHETVDTRYPSIADTLPLVPPSVIACINAALAPEYTLSKLDANGTLTLNVPINPFELVCITLHKL